MKLRWRRRKEEFLLAREWQRYRWENGEWQLIGTHHTTWYLEILPAWLQYGVDYTKAQLRQLKEKNDEIS